MIHSDQMPQKRKSRRRSTDPQWRSTRKKLRGNIHVSSYLPEDKNLIQWCLIHLIRDATKSSENPCPECINRHRQTTLTPSHHLTVSGSDSAGAFCRFFLLKSHTGVGCSCFSSIRKQELKWNKTQPHISGLLCPFGVLQSFRKQEKRMKNTIWQNPRPFETSWMQSV